MNDIQEMLKLKTWAVVGATDNQDKFGYKIFKCMKAAGYKVYPVNPGIAEVMGETCYPTLVDLPVCPEAVDLVVNRRIGVKVVEQCAELGIENIWMQPGADADNVIALAKEKGLKVIHNACIMTEIRNQEG